MIQRHRHGLCLARFQRNLFVALQFLVRSAAGTAAVANVQLNDLLSGRISGIGNVHTDRQSVLVRQHFLVQFQIAVRKCSIGQPVAKGERHRHFFCIIITVSHEYTFMVNRFLSLSEIQVGRIVRELVWNGFGKLSGGIDLSI